MFVHNIVDTLYDMGSQFAVVSYNEFPYIFITFEDQQASKAQLQNKVRLIVLFYCRNWPSKTHTPRCNDTI